MEPFEYRDVSNIPYFSLDLWENKFPHLVAGFSACHPDENFMSRNYAFHVDAEFEQVVFNRERLIQELGMSFNSWTCGEQVHKAHIVMVTKDERGRGNTSCESAIPDTDGLMTEEPDILLTSYYADCVPLYFYSPDIDVVGVAHAGWRGTMNGIGIKMMRELVRYGAEKNNILVAIGPSIGPCCYEVDKLVIEPLKTILSDKEKLEKVMSYNGFGKWKLDLKQVNIELLENEGVFSKNILKTKRCTSCDSDYFYSYRRDGSKTGRMVAWIGKRRGS